MIPVKYEKGKEIIKTNTCECGGQLSLAWGGHYGVDGYVLVCSNDPGHSVLSRQAELGPYDIPGFNLFNLKGRQKDMEKKIGTEKANTLTKYVGQASLQKVELKDIIGTLWPEAPEVDKAKAIMLCATYGLNPLNNHIFLIPFNKDEPNKTWVLVMSIHSKRLLASRRGPFSYMDNTPRIMTDDEQLKTFGEALKDRLYVVTKLRDPKTGAESIGYGFWLNKDKVKGENKGNTAFNMAAIRSESQALDRLCPGEMPLGIEAVEESAIEGEYSIIKPEGDRGVGEGQKNKEKPGTSAPSSPEGEGFSIDPTWLADSKRALKWTDETMKSYLVTTYKVDGQGALVEVLKRLTREQAQDFVNKINDRVQKQLNLFV